MTERTSFLRKIGYGVAIAVLAIGMMWLSAPATNTREGGKLAELRKQYKLAQVDLGKIDPASETIKLATLGLRGVAVNWLWTKANNYKKVEDWTNLTATLEQLAKLQPNFITFWKFQAWNLTYNVSVEFDDYNDRYYYVRRGIEFLKEGEDYNKDNPALLWDMGWFIGQKIGRADEHVQYRRLFKADDEYHSPDLTMDERDNWLVGKTWYEKAVDAVDNKGQSLGRKSPRDFYSSPAKSQMNYAEAIEEEGYFEKARLAWTKAAEEWREFGNRFIEHSTGVRMQLGAQPRIEKEIADLRTKMDALLPGIRDKIAAEKREELTSEDQKLLELPATSLTSEQTAKVYELNQRLEISDREVATRIAEEKPDVANQALQLASELDRLETVLRYTINYKRDSNYDYWQTRADFEQTPNALSARELMFRAAKAREEGDVVQARKLYEEGFAKWRLVIDEFPTILDEEATTGEDILEFIKKYRSLLEQFEETLTDEFPLWEVIERHDREQDFLEELADYHKRHPKPGQTPPAEAPAEGAQPEAAPQPEAGKSDAAQPAPAASEAPAPEAKATPSESAATPPAEAAEAPAPAKK